MAGEFEKLAYEAALRGGPLAIIARFAFVVSIEPGSSRLFGKFYSKKTCQIL